MYVKVPNVVSAPYDFVCIPSKYHMHITTFTVCPKYTILLLCLGYITMYVPYVHCMHVSTHIYCIYSNTTTDLI